MRYFSVFFLLLGVLMFSACNKKSKQQATSINKVVTILSDHMDCLDDPDMTCIKYYEGTEKEGPVKVRSAQIDGIVLEPGYEYVLDITETIAASSEDIEELSSWTVNSVISRESDEYGDIVPEKIEAVFYKNAEIKYSIAQGRKDLVRGDYIVFSYNRQKEHSKMIADDEFSEELLFQIRSDVDTFSTKMNPEKFKTLYGFYCFCPDTGIKPVMNGSMSGKKNEDGSYTVTMEFPEQKFAIQNQLADNNKPRVVFDSNWKETVTFTQSELNYGINDPSEMVLELHDTWMITEVMGTNIEGVKTFKVPVIDIYPSDLTFVGNDGCNQLSGRLDTLDENQISFGKIMMTRMACPDAPDLGISKALDKVVHWKKSENELIFYGQDDVVLLKMLQLQ